MTAFWCACCAVIEQFNALSEVDKQAILDFLRSL